MKKWMIAAVTIVLAVFFGVLLLSDSKAEKERAADFQQMKEAVTPLEEKKAQLEKEIEELDASYQKDSGGSATLALVFTELQEELYTDVYPLLKDKGYTGMLALSTEQYPGKKGCISLKQFQELLKEGWTYCIQWEDKAVTTRWREQSGLLEENGLDSPEIVYFPNGTYKEALDEYLLKNDYRIIVHHGEEERSLILAQEEEGIWHPGCMGWNDSGASNMLQTAVVQKGNLVFTVSFGQSDKFERNSFKNMLGKIDGYCSEASLKVQGLSEARKYWKKVIADKKKQEEEWKKKKTELEQQLTEVKSQIEELYLDRRKSNQ